MRPVFVFKRPNLLLSLGIQILGAFLLQLPYLPTASQALAAPPITPSGLNTQVNLSQTPPAGSVQYDITGGTRAGSNLFHSFGDFGVPTNNIANFLNGTGLQTSNILSRVTGGNPSNILGTIQTTGFGSANLFLMNPAGIVFGPNAALNVGGSVSFTTADYLRLADGGKFTAIPGSLDASISSAPVAAFGFLGSNPGAITVQGGHLTVPGGQALSLVGGNITIQASTLEDGSVRPAQLSAPGGQINLASIASPGELLAGTLAQVPNINGQSFGNLGTIQVSEQSVIDVSGNGGGTVLIRGGQFLLDNSTISANVTGPGSTVNGTESIGSGIDIQVSGNAAIQNLGVLETNVAGSATPGVTYGGVHVKADRIEIIGTVTLDDFLSGNVDFSAPPFTGIRSDVLPGATGNSGNITLEGNSIAMSKFAQLEAQVGCVSSSSCQSDQGGTGNAGNIKLTANQNLGLTGFATIQTATTNSTGNAGNIELTSVNGNISLTTFSQVVSNTALSSGNSSTIMVSAPHGDILLSDNATIGSGSFEGGAVGGIQITANNLQLNGGPNGISTITQNNLTNSPNAPGDITVTLSGNLNLNDGSAIFGNAFSATPAANMNITAHDVSVAGGSFITSGSQQAGRGGALNISADTVEMTTGGQIRSGSTVFFQFDFNSGTFVPVPPTGPGGTINIHGLAGGPATSVMIDGAGSGIFTNAEGTGAGGNTNISAQSVTVQNGGTLSASTSGIESSATGGNISISANQSVALNSGGSITASSTGPANAGNISINAGAQFLSQNASVTTEASQASGGNIVIQATDAIRLVNSQLSTSVQGGPTTSGGNITLDPAIVTLQNSQVLAQAVQGAGGNINIIAGTFLADQTSVVSASSQFGLSGAVNIQSPLSNLSGSLATLPQRPLQSQPLLQQRCAAQASGQLSSLVVAGRDRLPYEPGGWLLSSMAVLSEDVPDAQANPLPGADLAPPQQKMILSGQLYERHTPSPQQGVTSWAAGCGS